MFRSILRRLRPRFGVRVFLVFVILAGIGLGTIAAAKFRAVRRQREAVAALVKLNGYVDYGMQFRLVPYAPGLRMPLGQPIRNSWLRKWLGDDFVDQVTAVSLEGHGDSTDEDMIHLASLTDLERVCIDHVPLTDAGLGPLADLAKLRRLSLCNVPITDAALDGLSRLPSLTEVGLARTRIGDRALLTLGRMGQLRWLSLEWTRVTDAGLAHLKGLDQLEELDLAYTEITDAGLAHLRSLTSLKSLCLHATHVTPEGVLSIEAALPGCVVYWCSREEEQRSPLASPGPDIPEPKPRILFPGPEN